MGTRTTLTFAWMLACLPALSPAVRAGEAMPTGAFALGRGGAAAKVAVDVQHRLRELAATTGLLRPLDMQAVLDTDALSDRQTAIEEARNLLEEGKSAYEQLDLEVAQVKLEGALKKIEFGYGHMDKPTPLIETIMYLGASLVLMGEPDKAVQIFQQAYDIPGKKLMDSELFPPNIQEIFEQARQAHQTAPRGKVSLVSEPQGAVIYLDHEYRGGSPLQVDELRVGDHLVRALKDGYRPWGGRVKVETDKLRRFKITLKPSARRAEFSKAFAALAAELLKGDPGPASLAMAELLGAERMALVVLDGEAGDMLFRGFMATGSDPLRLTRVEERLDTTAASFDDRLKAYLLRLLGSTPGQEEIDAGEADAARLVARVDGGEDPPEGLDLGDGGEGPPAGQVDDAKDDVKAEEARKVVEDTSKKKPADDEGEAAFSWAYLHDKWWFWTALGVVVVSAGVGLGVGLGTGSDSAGGGELVLGLH